MGSLARVVESRVLKTTKEGSALEMAFVHLMVKIRLNVLARKDSWAATVRWFVSETH